MMDIRRFVYMRSPSMALCYTALYCVVLCCAVRCLPSSSIPAPTPEITSTMAVRSPDPDPYSDPTPNTENK